MRFHFYSETSFFIVIKAAIIITNAASSIKCNMLIYRRIIDPLCDKNFIEVVDKMNSWLIILSSSTHAIKAQRFLARRGYKTSIERVQRGNLGGCKSGLRVYEDTANICRMLSDIGIICREIIEG